MSAAAESTFDLICERPSMYGTPAQVEAMLWVCMFIWSQDHEPVKRPVYDAIKTVRKRVRALDDRAGMSFFDMSTGPFDYSPVVTNMQSAFNILREQAY